MINLFKYSENEEGYVSAVVKARYVDEFKAMGFAETPEEAKKPEQKKTVKAATKTKLSIDK